MTLRPGPAPADPRRRSHLRLALATGVPFAVLWGAWFALAGTLPPGPGGLGIIAVAAVVAGVFFGRAMSLVLGGEQL
jgi:predicted secreted protein